MSQQTLSFIVPSIIILSLVVLIAGIVSLILRVRRGQPLGVTFPFILSGYFYFISLLSLIILAGGLSTLVGAGLSTIWGKEFTYQKPHIVTVEPPPPPSPLPIEAPPKLRMLSPEEQQARQERQVNLAFRRDLVAGSLLSAVSLAIWLAHTLGRRRLERRWGQRDVFLGRAYSILLLAFFSVASLIILANAIQQTVNYFIFEPQDIRFFGPRQPPGGSLGQVIVFGPIWILSLRSVLKGGQEENASEKS